MMMLKISLITLVTWIAFFKTGQCQMPGLGGGMGSMSFGMAMRGEIPPHQYMLLDSAVKQIIGPAASPTPGMISVALRQGGPPATLAQMMEYTPFFMLVARELDVKPPGIVGRPTTQQLQNYIMQRSNQWMQANLGFQAMNVDPTMAMMMNANNMNQAPSAPAAAPNTAPTAPQTSAPAQPQSALVASSAGYQPYVNAGGMGGNSGGMDLFHLMAMGGMDAFGMDGLGMGLF